MKRLIKFALSLMCVIMSLSPIEAIKVVAEEVNPRNNSEMFADMRQYWFDELTGVDPAYMDEDLSSVVTKLDVTAKKYLESMNDFQDSTVKLLWSDDTFLANVTDARITETLDRLKMIGIQVYNPNSEFYQNSAVINKIIEALNFVLAKQYNDKIASVGNWWDGDIGIPKALVDTTILFYNAILEKKPQLVENVIKAIDKHVPYANRRGTTSFIETGANLIDKVAIVMKRSLLDQNHERLEHAKTCMGPLYGLVTSGDGFYSDGSFIFHTNIAYNGSYGAVLIDEMVNCLGMLSFSDIPATKKELNFLNAQIINAYFPIITIGGNIVDSVRGRAISRMSQQGDTMGARVIGTILQYADVTDSQTSILIKSELKTILDQKYQGVVTQNYSLISYSDIIRLKKLVANEAIEVSDRQDFLHQYSYMNKTIATRKNFTFALSMSSGRIYNTETGNAENTRGYYQGQGMSQVYTLDNNQYNEDYWALVDPYRLPGVTTGHQDLASGTKGQNNWAGGSTLDGVNGVSGQVITGNKTLANGNTSGISANKSWFVLNDRIIAMGSDIKNGNNSVDEVETIVDNRRITASAKLFDEYGNSLANSANSSSKWFLLEDQQATMGYVLLDANTINYKIEERSGAWYDINQIGKFTNHEDKKGNFASLAISHGQNPTASTYQYMMIPEATKESIQEYAANPQIQVIQAEQGIHAIKDESTLQEFYNFFAAGDGGNVSVNAPVSITMKQENSNLSLAVADPQRSLSSVEITIKNLNTKNIEVLSGQATIKNTTEDSMTLVVNFDVKDGQSQIIELGAAFAIRSNNMALNKTASASNVVANASSSLRQPEFVVDGDTGIEKFWASEYLLNGVVNKSLSDAWFMVDLGSVQKINQAVLHWNTGRAKKYELQVSETGEEGSFNTVYRFDDTSSDKAIKNKKRIDSLEFDAIQARYIRMMGIERTSEYWTSSDYLRGGYTLLELELYNTLSIRSYIHKAEQLLADFPKEIMVQLSSEEYDILKTEINTILEDAKQSMDDGNDYVEEEIQLIAEKLSKAIDAFAAKIIHVTQLSLDITELSVNKGDIFTLKAIIEPQNANLKTVSVTSSNENIIEVMEEGKLRAVGVGDAIIMVTSKDQNLQATAALHVTVNPQRITLSHTTFIMKKDQTAKLDAIIYPKDAKASVTWSSGDDSIIKVDENGSLTALRKGTTIVTATIEDTNLNASCTVEVEIDYTAQSGNLAKGKDVMVSSVVQNANTENRFGKFANDGKLDTRWASEYLLEGKEDLSFDRDWIVIDLGEAQWVNSAKLFWEASKAKDYDLLGSINGQEYFVLKEYRSDDTGTEARNDELSFESKLVRFVKMQGIDRSSNHNASRGGYSLYEIEVYDVKDYFALVAEAKSLIQAYPNDNLEEYIVLKRCVNNLESLVDSGSFDSNQLYIQLNNLEVAIQNYKKQIIPLVSIGMEPQSVSLLVGQSAELSVTLTPNNATNLKYQLTSADLTIAKVVSGQVIAINPGQTTITALSEDGKKKAQSIITVRTNTFPKIHGSNITMSLFSDFDELTDVSATDFEDGDLLVELESSNLNTNQTGSYEIIYFAVDSDGNKANWTRQVTVVKDSESGTTKKEGNFEVFGLIHPNAKLIVNNQSENAELKEQLTKTLNREVVSIYDLSLSLRRNSDSMSEGALRITLPTVNGYSDIHVYIKNGDTLDELEVWFNNTVIHFDTDILGQFIIAGSKTAPPVVIPDENINTTSKPSNSSNKLIEEGENDGNVDVKELEPETKCESGDCGENQKPVINEKSASSQELSIWVYAGLGILMMGGLGAIALRMYKKKE